jgi:hypothetical protein
MNRLNKLGAIATSTARLDSLAIDEEYLIEKWCSVQTKFGRRIAVEIGGEQYFLPRRFSEFTEEQLVEFNTCEINLVFKGKKSFGNCLSTCLLQFIEKDTSDSNENQSGEDVCGST